MKAINFYIFLLPSILFLLSGCCKEETYPVDLEEFYECHTDMNWDLQKISKRLVGEWNWEFISCFWSPENANGDDNKGMSIVFNSDNTLDVKQNGKIEKTSSWKVVDDGYGTLMLEVEPRVEQLYGNVLFCEGRVGFISSYYDGCDNYFTRKE